MCPLYSRLVWYRCHLFHYLVTILLVGRSALYCRIYKTLNFKKMMSYDWVYLGNSILIRNLVLSAAAKHQYAHGAWPSTMWDSSNQHANSIYYQPAITSLAAPSVPPPGRP